MTILIYNTDKALVFHRGLAFGCHCWLVQQCEAGTRRPLLGKPAVAPNSNVELR